jgi:hypothetical protein
VPAAGIIEFVHEQRGDVGKFIHSMVDA